MAYYDVDAYPTDHGWVARVTRLDRYGQDELVSCSELGFESETEVDALRRGARCVLSTGGKIRRVTATI
jgi:hypothetical protein